MSPTLAALPPTEGLAEKLRIAIWIGGAGSGPGWSLPSRADSVAIGCCNCPSVASTGAAPASAPVEHPAIPPIPASALAIPTTIRRTSPRFMHLPFPVTSGSPIAPQLVTPSPRHTVRAALRVSPSRRRPYQFVGAVRSPCFANSLRPSHARLAVQGRRGRPSSDSMPERPTSLATMPLEERCDDRARCDVITPKPVGSPFLGELTRSDGAPRGL